MKINFKLAASIPLLLITSACASITLAPAGSYKNEQEVNLDRDWSDQMCIRDSPDAIQVLKLNKVVSASIILNEQLPTKKGKFEWTLGEDVKLIIPSSIPENEKPKYALFIEVEGTYSSAGRKPVSYTHLDVYKRQIKARIMKIQASLRDRNEKTNKNAN